jgi:hypothetical protein
MSQAQGVCSTALQDAGLHYDNLKLPMHRVFNLGLVGEILENMTLRRILPSFSAQYKEKICSST